MTELTPDVRAADAALARRIMRVAWWSILLGLALEAVVLTIQSLGAKTPALATIAADTAQKVTWSVFVCAALAIANSAAKAVRALACSATGLLCAPAAFILAKSSHKAVNTALDGTAAALTAAPSPWVLAGIKAAEFAALGFLAGRMTARGEARLKHFAFVGAGVGAVFGAIFVGYVRAASAPTPPAVAAVAGMANEILYPTGCAIVLYASDALGPRLMTRR